MKEQESQQESPNGKESPPKPSRRNAYVIGAFAGSLFGVPTELIGIAMGKGDKTLPLSAEVFSATGLAFAGQFAKNISLNEAEELFEEGKSRKAKLKIAQASIENSMLYLAIPIFALNIDTSYSAIGTGLGISIGTFYTLKEWEKRTKKFPQLVVPDNCSITRDLDYPERNNGFKMPPVFLADSIADVKQFRELNKEQIVNWSGRIPRENKSLPIDESIPPLVSSAFIIPNVRHYPLMDPENKDIKLMDANDYIMASPIEHSETIWPDESIFEDEFSPGMRLFYEEEWQSWKNKSWKHDIAILAQYRDTDNRKIRLPFRKTNIDKVVDKYWLIDIFAEDDGEQEEEIQIKEKSPNLIPIFQT